MNARPDALGRRHRVLAAVAAGASLLALTGCVSMPTSGRVVDAAKIVAPDTDEGFSITPRPPQKGASPTAIVQGFFDAMQATPIQTTVARQFLTKGLAGSWNPEHETITYADKTPPHGDTDVAVDLTSANHLDAQGAWLGPLPVDQAQVRLSLTRQSGEWRIASAPNALIVPQSWFESRFSQVSLYYFDPTGTTLVPEPVFVPDGPQLATTLVRDLVSGPGPRLAGVVRSFLPAGLSAGLSVPVSADGLARVDLTGGDGQLSPHALQLMNVQLASTLRQDSGISAFRLTFGGSPAQLPNGASQVDVATAAQFAMPGAPVRGLLFGLRKGLLVEGDGHGFAPVSGPFGTGAHALRSVAVNLSGTRAAGVSTDGASVYVGPLRDKGALKRLSGLGAITGILKPSWDDTGRLWIAGKTRGKTVVEVVDNDRSAPVDVPGVTGTNVRKLLVSRDGSRLIALVRAAANDTVVVSRIRRDDQGRVLGATAAQVISDVGGGPVRIDDVTWRSPTSVAALQQLSGIALIRTYSVDGAISDFPGVSLTVSGRLRSLVGSPEGTDSLYATAGDDVLDVSTGGVARVVDQDITALTYAG